ncbi:pyrimidine dimer DNA glycosylase/endonuclease V [Macrococcus armenti]|uniref:pyrimidine dimer DNA glycosylase/endonuclease V n=1 Tax=Macrococcus armenti TaxID=2875764 RepID=UPI0030B9FE81
MDNRRLSKQVLELYQIIRVCLAEMNVIEGNTRYLHHPIVKHVYNEGHPYIIDAYKMLEAMDKEHQRRGENVLKTLKKT